MIRDIIIAILIIAIVGLCFSLSIGAKKMGSKMGPENGTKMLFF